MSGRKVNGCWVIAVIKSQAKSLGSVSEAVAAFEGLIAEERNGQIHVSQRFLNCHVHLGSC